MKELKTAGVRLPDSPLVPYPSRSLVPERDVRYAPVLEASRLGIDFGGLTAVDDFTLTIGDRRTDRPQRSREDHGL